MQSRNFFWSGAFFLTLIFPFSQLAVAQKKVQAIVQKGHGEATKAIAITHDQKYLVSGSRDKTLKLWDLHTGFEIRTFTGHDLTVNSISISDNDQQMASGSADCTARVWELETGKALWQSQKRKNYVTDVALHPTKPWVAVAGYDAEVEIWDWKKNELVAEMKANSDRGTGYGVSLAFSPDGKWLAVGQDNRLVQVYITSNWSQQWVIKSENGSCGGCGTLVAFSPDSKHILRANRNSGLDEFSLATGKQERLFKAKIDDVTSVSYHPEGKSVLLCTEDSLFIYQRNGEIQSAHTPTKQRMNDAILLNDEEMIVAEDQGLLFKFNIKSGKTTDEFAGTLNKRDFGGLVHDLSNYWEHNLAKHIKYKNEQLLIRGKWLLKGKMGTKGVLWNLGTGRPTHELTGHKKGIISFDYNVSTDDVVTASGDGEVIRWQGETAKELMRYKGHSTPVFDVVISHDGKKMATCAWGGEVLIWNLATGKVLNKLYFDDVAGYEMAFSQNDEYLIIGFLNKKLQLWDIDSETLVRDYIGHTEIITSIQVIDNESFISTAKDGRAIRWNIGNGLKANKIQHPTGGIYAQYWLASTTQLFTAGTDGLIRLWDTEMKTVSQTFVGHQTEVTSLNLSADLKTLYSLDLDGVTKAWNLETGLEIYEFIQISTSEWLIKSPEGYFDGTSEAMKMMHFVKGMNSYSLDQFFDVFYKPKAISDLLSFGVMKERGSIEELMVKLSPPKVKLVATPNKEGTEAEIFIQVSESNAKQIKLLHNGKRLPIDKANFLVFKKTDDYTIYQTKQALVSGHNEFSCRATGKNEVESAITSVDILSNRKTPGADCYLISIGIDNYKNSQLNLNYAGADATAFADSVVKFSKGMYRNTYTFRLSDGKASKYGIEHLLDSLANIITLNDVFIFYYAGHGSISEEHFYFIPHDATQLYADVKSMSKTAISEEAMMLKFQQIKALKQMVVMDACHSGGAVEALAQRGAMKEKAIAQLSRSAGIHVLASAGSEQFATEYDSLGHGLFTYCLLEALSGKADGAPADKKVTLFEIKSFLHDQVPSRSMELKGSAQYPFTFSRGHDFPIVILRREEE